ncbi:MAG: murein biosynthesis integral membrane protein MurJ [Actinobacteria bacterium]|nr:murein biosynthesis integral membrane protein MurJ [Actinomycetota bacterium]
MSSEPTDSFDAPPPADDLRRSSFLVGAGILLSRVAGLVRESATAAFLGTGVGADALRAALRIPNLMQNLLGEGVLSASFIPAYSRLLAEGREEDAGRLAGAVAGLLMVVTSALVLIGTVFAGPITRILAPGWTPGSDRFELTVLLVRILTPGVGLLVLSAWCLGVLNSHRRFFLSYVAPVAWNTAIIVVLLAVGLSTSDEFTVAQGFAWGALLGSALQFGVQLPSVLRLVRGLRLSASLAVPGVRAVVGRFGQVVAGRGGVQLATYVDIMVASLLAAGAMSALGFAQILYLLPISLFGMAIAAAELPTLSTLDHGDRQRVLARIDRGLGRVAFFVVPSTVAFLLAGDLVVATVFQRGNFSADASRQVGTVLAVYSLGMLASTSSRLLQSALYGVGDTRNPAVYAVMRVVLSLLVGVAVMFPLDAVEATREGFAVVDAFGWQVATEQQRLSDDNLFRLGAAGLAFGAAVGAWFELALLRIRLRVVFGRVRLGGHYAARLGAGAGAAAVAALALRTVLDDLGWHPTIAGVLAMAGIGAVYVLVTRLLGVPEARELTGRVERLLRR